MTEHTGHRRRGRIATRAPFNAGRTIKLREAQAIAAQAETEATDPHIDAAVQASLLLRSDQSVLRRASCVHPVCDHATLLSALAGLPHGVLAGMVAESAQSIRHGTNPLRSFEAIGRTSFQSRGLGAIVALAWHQKTDAAAFTQASRTVRFGNGYDGVPDLLVHGAAETARGGSRACSVPGEIKFVTNRPTPKALLAALRAQGGEYQLIGAAAAVHKFLAGDESESFRTERRVPRTDAQAPILAFSILAAPHGDGVRAVLTALRVAVRGRLPVLEPTRFGRPVAIDLHFE